MQCSGKIRVFAVLFLTAVFTMTAYGFTAQNSVPSSNAGFGSGEITGYTVTNIEYTPFSGSPTTISGVEFDLDKPATTISVRFGLAGGGTTGPLPCAHVPQTGRPYHWTCGTAQSFASVVRLDIAAAQ
jgi:hypothetical protein